MEVPLLDLKAQYNDIKSEIDKVVRDVIDSQYFILSGEVTSLESEVARYAGVTSAAGVASGTDALILALRAAGISQGDVVITSPFTFFATAESVSLLGGVPVFVDIDPETYNIDPDKLERYLSGVSPDVRSRIKAVIPVHIYGQCADMGRICDIAEKYELTVIEDCAQSIGAIHNGRQAGSFGSAGCFSFFPSKNLGGFGDGGMVVSGDDGLITRIKELRVHGSRQLYIHEEIGYNSRLDSLQAAILRVKLKNLDRWLEGRRSVAARYDNALAPMGVVVPKVMKGNVHTYHQYTIAVDERDDLLKHLNDSGIAARIYYPVPLHLQPCYRDLGYEEGSMPVSENCSKRVLSLPVYPELSDAQIEYVIDTIGLFMKRK